MKMLAIEFSSAQRSVAVLVDGAVKGEASETGGRGSHALKMIGDALAQAGVEREEIECLVVGLGPGSYTGIRAAIALAQGWQLAAGGRHLGVIGISSAECLAAEAQAKGWHGRTAVVIDAQRGELYLAGYEVTAPVCRETLPLELAGAEKAQGFAAAGWVIVGPEAEKFVPGSRILFPGAATLGRLAQGRPHAVEANEIEPIYLRETTFVKAPPPRAMPA
jgi:tRNA threonylcarbamoyl adenosine modification protein YeaZ